MHDVLMKRLLLIAFLLAVALPAAFSAHARESFQAAVTSVAPLPSPHPSLYSFADVYRLTVVGQAPALPQPAESPMRVAVAQSPLVPDAQFLIKSVREPQRWALLIAGLLLAGWVARRRLDTLL
jgi:hypothetical protein